MRGVPPDQRAEMVRLYAEGISSGEIGRRMFWTPSTVRAALVKEGVTLRNRGGWAHRSDGITREDVDRAVELYQAGRSMEEVGAILGLHRTNVAKRLARAGVSRSRTDSHRCHYRALIAENGTSALSDRQASALRFLESSHARVNSEDVARACRLTPRAAREVLRQLENYGLAKGTKRGPDGPRYRSWKRTDLAITDVLDHELAPPVQRRSNDVWLPIAPFRDWLERLIRIEQMKAPAVPSDQRGKPRPAAVEPGAAAVCKHLQMNDRRLYALRFEQQSVTLSAADAVLLRWGDGTRLEDLWPELGSDSEVERLPRSYQQRAEMEARKLPVAA